MTTRSQIFETKQKQTQGDNSRVHLVVVRHDDDDDDDDDDDE